MKYKLLESITSQVVCNPIFAILSWKTRLDHTILVMPNGCNYFKKLKTIKNNKTNNKTKQIACSYTMK